MSVLLFVGALSGAIVGVAGVGAVVWRIVRWCVRLVELVELVEQRSQELVPNGGASLKDTIGRVETQVAELAARVDQMSQP